ncbi:endonuclease/exonuclease/phosphatase family protein [Micromonospora sp. KC606]|uniref:endonuclease/exonuclease/phosphatase family protein n=1 Tax=Micromonospora sp. KC606 TaxID=2530379 RepID=UPI001042FB51|nr:endonuclease/exonuclease/phosphatase family protein [Micromonospora sp. KC606]TDC73194.1 endonuclease/exonuclease/phosphatase family protein [Micromonospora sp. KC606]
MADLSYDVLRRLMAALCLIAAAAVPAEPAAGTGSTSLRVLQMNLCNSGRAGCYTGRAVPRAAEVIRAETPHLVTLNEICRDDVPALERVLADVHRGGRVVAAFQAAGDRPSGDVTRCRDGQPYGIGLLAHLAAPQRGHRILSGTYPVQDGTDPELRVWLCVHAPGVAHACTTHLAAFRSAVALAQCRHLIDHVVPRIRRDAGYLPTVLGGDLNLRHGGSPDVRACVPPGHRRVDDGGVQQIVATTDITVDDLRPVGMNGATDHPGLLAGLTVDADQDR